MQEESKGLFESFEIIYSKPMEALSKVLEDICKTVRCTCGVILTIDKQNKKLELDVLYNYPPEIANEFRSKRLKLPIERDTSKPKDYSVSAEALNQAIMQGKPVPLFTLAGSSLNFSLWSEVKEVLGYAVKSMDEYVAVLTLESIEEGVFKRFLEEGEDKLEEFSYLILMALSARQSLVYKFDEFIKENNFNDVVSLSREVIGWVFKKFNVNSCNLYFIEDDESSGLEYIAARECIFDGKAEHDVTDMRYRMGEGYCGWVARYNTSMILTDFNDPESKALDEYAKLSGERPKRTGRLAKRLAQKYPGLEFKSYLGVPIIHGKKVVGVLEILDPRREYAFTDEGLLEIIARRIGSEYGRILKEKGRENFLFIPNVENLKTDREEELVKTVVKAAIQITTATDGFFMEKVGDAFHVRAFKGHNLRGGRIKQIVLNNQTLLDYIFDLKTRRDFISQDILKDIKPETSKLSEELRLMLQNTRVPGGFIPENMKSLMIVPVYLKVPTRDGAKSNEFEDLGALILMSNKSNAFEQDAVIVTTLAAIVSYHIWSLKKLQELAIKERQVSELKQLIPFYPIVVKAAVASAGTVHTARRHIMDVRTAIEELLRHKKITSDKDLLDIANKIAKPFTELADLYDRLTEVFGGVEPKFEEFKLADVVQDVRDYLEPTFRNRKIDFINNVKANLPMMKGDLIQLKVVFINLLTNSIDANARKITVSAKECTMGFSRLSQEPAVEIHFKDDGTGIPAEQLPHVFRPFLTANKKKGTGLGLAVNHEIVELHKGEIEIVSSVVGEGTTISIKLPLDPNLG